MKCLGMDLGTKTLGIAISDKTNFLASPLTTLRFEENNYEKCDYLLKLYLDYKQKVSSSLMHD